MSHMCDDQGMRTWSHSCHSPLSSARWFCGLSAGSYGLLIHPDIQNVHGCLIHHGWHINHLLKKKSLTWISHFKYIRTTITHIPDEASEICTQVVIAKDTLNHCTYLKSFHVNTMTKLHRISSLTYVMCFHRTGRKSQSLLMQLATGFVFEGSRNQINARTHLTMKSALWQHLLGHTWQDMVTAAKLKWCIKGPWTFSSNTLFERKADWCGHAACCGGLLAAVIPGLPTQAKRECICSNARWVDDLIKWSSLCAEDLKAARWSRTKF